MFLLTSPKFGNCPISSMLMGFRCLNRPQGSTGYENVVNRLAAIVQAGCDAAIDFDQKGV
jgi:hypothetical protein